MSTDKSSLHRHEELGRVHTSQDKEITRAEFVEIENIINGHTSMHIKMQVMGPEFGLIKAVIKRPYERIEDQTGCYWQ